MTDREQVTEILREAAKAVAAAGLSDELQGVAFGKAVDLIAGVERTRQRDKGHKAQEPDGSDSSDLIQKIATKLDLDRELVDETFEIEDGDVRLTIARPKLDRAKRVGTKQIAILVAAARQAAGIEEKTKAQTIRQVADDYGKLDPPNFAATMHELGDYLSISGTRLNREVKVKRGGFEEAAASIKRLQGQS